MTTNLSTKHWVIEQANLNDEYIIQLTINLNNLISSNSYSYIIVGNDTLRPTTITYIYIEFKKKWTLREVENKFWDMVRVHGILRPAAAPNAVNFIRTISNNYQEYFG